jgi:thioredoxin 2
VTGRPVRCRACGSTNRIDPERLRAGQDAVCGRCRALLPVSAKPLAVTDRTFDEEVLGSPLPVLVDLWAPWCLPCRGLAPVVEETARTLAGRVRVAKLNVDDNPETAGRLRLQGIPTLVLFDGGHEVSRVIGARGLPELLLWLEQVS